MLINSNFTNSTSFGINPHSPKLRYSSQDFYVNIKGYGTNPIWAKKTIDTADSAVEMIRQNSTPEKVIHFIADGIRNANKFCFNKDKRSLSGLLRTERNGWNYKDIELSTQYDGGRYVSYQKRLDDIFIHPLKSIDDKIGMTRPDGFHTLQHGCRGLINTSLEHVLKLCTKIFPKYVNKEITPHDMPEVNDTIAEIRWVMAHSTPWVRGSDAISNVLTRVMYKAIGVKTYPLKSGVSLDMEAYCTNLEKYKKNFPQYFTKAPEIID